MSDSHCEVCGERVRPWDSLHPVKIKAFGFNPRREMCGACFEVFKDAVCRALRWKRLSGEGLA